MRPRSGHSDDPREWDDRQTDLPFPHQVSHHHAPEVRPKICCFFNYFTFTALHSADKELQIFGLTRRNFEMLAYQNFGGAGKLLVEVGIIGKDTFKLYLDIRQDDSLTSNSKMKLIYLYLF